MEIFFVFCAVVFGLIWGSFLNVCIYRMPKEESVVFPRSYCPNCKHPIAFYDNMPILSYILLRGKCRHCSAPISIRYPVIEAISGLIWGIAVWRHGISLPALIEIVFFSILLLSTAVDFAHRIIPDEASVGGALAGLVLSFLYPQLHGQSSHLWGLFWSFVGLLAGGALVYLVAIVGELIFKKEAMGGGDIKFQAMVGAFLGWQCAIAAFFIATFIGAIMGIYILIRYKDNTLPFGPCLALSALICYLWGERLLSLIVDYLAI